MKKFSKAFTLAFISIVLLSSLSVPVSATAAPGATIAQNTSITQRAEVIVTKYRIYNNQLQKRRWSETYGYWVDPYWITISQ